MTPSESLVSATEQRLLREIGPEGRAELIAVLTAPEVERAAFIGRLHDHADADLVAELLLELEVHEPARLRFVAALREMLNS